MRRLLRDVAEHREIGDVTTLADANVMTLIGQGLEKNPGAELYPLRLKVPPSE